MAQLAALVITKDEEFRRQATHLLRAGGVPIAIVEGRAGEAAAADLGVVDVGFDLASGLAAIERLRADTRRSRSSRWRRRRTPM